MSKPILVIGATGKQGGAVVRNLVSSPLFSPEKCPIYAVTRSSSSASAQKLAQLSPAIQLITGDLNDVPAIFKSLPSKPYGVYLMTNPGKNETLEGTAVIDEAIKAGVSHFVFSSVDRGTANGGFVPTEVPHFITKHEIEAHLYTKAKEVQGTMSYTIIRPPFFMDNLDWGFLGKVVGTIWRDYTDKPLIMIDTKDIGKVAAAAILNPDDEKYKNQSINLAGDRLTFEEGDAIFKELTGNPIPTTYGVFPWLLLNMSHDFKAMVKFWNDVEFGGDAVEGRAKFGAITFNEWLANSSLVKRATEQPKSRGGIRMMGL